MLESFTIFHKYDADHIHQASHDQIWAGPPVDEVSEEDLKRLSELKWIPDDDCFTMMV